MGNLFGRRLTVPFVLTVLVIFSGCYKDNFDFDRMKQDMITWEPDIAFPIVYSIMDAEKIIGIADSTNVYEYDADNFITLIYTRRVFSQTLNDFFQLPLDQAQTTSIALNPTETVNFSTSSGIVVSRNTALTLNMTGPGGSQLNKVRLDAGTMELAISSSFEHSGTLKVTIPELRLSGTPFSQSYPINYTAGTVNVNVSIPLAGYELDMDNGNGPNTFPINYELTLTNTNGNAPATSHQVQISHSFHMMRMGFADGYFGNFNLQIDPGEVEIGFAKKDHPGALYFQDPRFKFRIKNTIGAEMYVTLNDLYATGNAGQLDLSVSSLLPTGQFIVPAAPSLGDSAKLEYYFNKDNSNIKPIINAQYNKIYYDVDAGVNPNGQAYNFAYRNSSVEVMADVELPLWGFSDHFMIIDTLEVPFDEAADFADKIEKGMLRINTVSHFPIDGLLKLYFLDSNYVAIDSVLTDGSYVIRSGTVNNEGKTISATQTNNDVELNRDRIDHLFASRYLLIVADITTTDNANRDIKLFVEDNIKVQIGLRVKLKASPSVIDDF